MKRVSRVDCVRPTLTSVALPDPPERWHELGFEITSGDVLLPGVRVVLGAPRMSVAIDGVSELPAGLVLEQRDLAPAYTNHRNGAVGLDHLVALTPDFDSTIAELARVGLPLKRIRDGGGFRQGFRRLGGPILEVVEVPGAAAPSWWGLTVAIADLAALPSALTSPAKPAVQPGRLIATANSPGTPLAFITPES